MATNRQIEIDVVLNMEQAEKGFEQLDGEGKHLGETFTGVGDSVKGMTRTFTSMGDEATQKLGGVGDAIFSTAGALKELGSATVSAGGAFTGLIAPIGAAVYALFELIKAYQEYKNELNGANIAQEAYKASVSEVTSAIEELAANQVELNRAEVENLQNLAMKAKLNIESAQNTNERNAILYKNLHLQKLEIERIKENIAETKKAIETNNTFANSQISSTQLLAMQTEELRQAEIARDRIKSKMNANEQKSIDLATKGQHDFKKFEAEKERLLKRSPKVQKEITEAEIRLFEDSRLSILKLQTDNVKAQTEIARIESARRIREITSQEQLSMGARVDAIVEQRKYLNRILEKLEQDAEAKAEADRKRRYQTYLQKKRQQQAKELALERQRQNELRAIRSLEIDRLKIFGATEDQILKVQYEEQLKQAKDNLNLQKTARIKYENDVMTLILDRAKERESREQQEEQRRLERQRQFERQARAFQIESLEFDAQRIEDETERELALLDLRYQRTIEAQEFTQDQLTEIQRRHALEREDIIKNEASIMIDVLQEVGNQLAQAGAQAVYANLVAGEGFVDSIGKSIYALGQQAAVQSALSFAESIGRLAMGDTAGAGLKAKAGAMYAGVATLAGVTASKMGVGGSGGGENDDESPSGLSQTSTPTRERASQEAIVYNINFGGAVIYDTKTAAEQALADRVTQLQNRRRRGGVMRRSS